MSLGVLNNLSAVYAENNLNNTTNSLNTVLQQLSSGSKINSGADDAAGLSLVDGLQANQQALMQSQTNATEGVGLLQVADGALSQVTSLLNRAVTLATEASNGTLNSSQDTAANQEYQSILSEVNNIGTTTTYNQQAVFNSSTNIYTGDSSNTGASIDSLNIRTLSASNLGDTSGTMSYSSGQTNGNVFVDLSNDGTEAAITDSLGASTSTTTIAVSHLVTGADGAVSSESTNITVGNGTLYSNSVQGMISAINNSGLGLTASFGTAAKAGGTAAAEASASQYGGGSSADTGIIISGAGVGTGTNSAGEIGALSVNNASDSLTGTLNVVGSNGATHAITLGSADTTDNIADLATTINSAGYGITASVSGTTLTFTSASSATSVSGTSLSDTEMVSDSSVATSHATQTAGTAGTVGTITVGNLSTVLSGAITLTGIDGTTNSITLGTTTGSNKTDTIGDLEQTINNYAAAHTNFGLTASISGDVLTIAAAAGGADASSMSIGTAVTGKTPTPTSDPLTGVPSASGTANSSKIGTLALGGSGETTNDVLGGTLTIGSNPAITLGGTGTTDTLADLAKTINAGNYGVTATYNQSSQDIVFNSVNSAITISGSSLVDTTDSTNGTLAYTAASGTPTTSTFYTTGVTGTVSDKTTAVVVNGTSTYGGTSNTGFISDASGTNGIATISYTDAAGANLSSTDLTNQTNAESALTALNAAITDVAAQDGYIGAQINTLNSVSSVLSTQQENVQSAQNAVQATDYASATSNMSKYEILSQTGISALAQANSMQQEVTKLLQ